MSRLKGFISQLFAAPDSSSASSDDALLARYREGDGAAFEILYARHRQGLYRFLLGLSGKPELADEVFQETWLSLIRSASQP
ncbi:RNA polymerase subunit sigma, partial [Pseudomonas sp. HMWF005]